MRTSTLDQLPWRMESQIASFKLANDSWPESSLWFQTPGSIVACDHCERNVPLSMGAMQGAPGQSKFAQFEFLCRDCMQILQNKELATTPTQSESGVIASTHTPQSWAPTRLAIQQEQIRERCQAEYDCFGSVPPNLSRAAELLGVDIGDLKDQS